MASAFNRLGQYASSSGNRAYCYAELIQEIWDPKFFTSDLVTTLTLTLTP